jgi:hypothetical protein
MSEKTNYYYSLQRFIGVDILLTVELVRRVMKRGIAVKRRAETFTAKHAVCVRNCTATSLLQLESTGTDFRQHNRRS